MLRLVGGVILLVARGVLLWVVVPVGVTAWVVTYPAAALLRRRVRLPQLLGWADLNLIATIQRMLPRRMVGRRIPFIGWNGMGSVTHRIGVADPA